MCPRRISAGSGEEEGIAPGLTPGDGALGDDELDAAVLGAAAGGGVGGDRGALAVAAGAQAPGVDAALLDELLRGRRRGVIAADDADGAVLDSLSRGWERKGRARVSVSIPKRTTFGSDARPSRRGRKPNCRICRSLLQVTATEEAATSD